MDVNHLVLFSHHLINPLLFFVGAELQADHPGFQDLGTVNIDNLGTITLRCLIAIILLVYRQRRSELASLAEKFKQEDSLPIIQYTPDEINTWCATFDTWHMANCYTSKVKTVFSASIDC